MNDDKAVPKEMEEAMDNVIALEKLELSALLDHILKLKNQQVALKATEIYANKELHFAETGEYTKRSPSPDEKRQLLSEIDELHGALLNHKLVRDAMQNAALNIKKQEVVTKSLRKLETEDTVDQFPEKGVLLSHYSKNLDTSKTLVEVLEEKEQLDRDILELQLKYKKCLREIHTKWKAFDSHMVPLPEESENVTLFRTRVKEREDKVQILISMLQGLIATSGYNWGAEDYYVQVMLLCDLAVTNGDSAEMEATIKELELLHLQKEKELQKKDRNIRSFITSTPKQRKK